MSDANQPVGQAPITIHGQYIKDLSFENPRAPQSLQLTAPPQYSLNVRCDARNLEQPGMFEVTMTVELDGKDQQGQAIFVMELVYAGVVSVGSVPQEAIGPIIGIHVPMLLFPFARAIVTMTLSQAALLNLPHLRTSGRSRLVATSRTRHSSQSDPLADSEYARDLPSSLNERLPRATVPSVDNELGSIRISAGASIALVL